jgi:hypothetical protein
MVSFVSCALIQWIVIILGKGLIKVTIVFMYWMQFTTLAQDCCPDLY